jgi:hypothetical protein
MTVAMKRRTGTEQEQLDHPEPCRAEGSTTLSGTEDGQPLAQELTLQLRSAAILKRKLMPGGCA